MSLIYRHDQEFRDRGFRVIAGLDEAGRGPLAGPVVAAAVILPPAPVIKGVRDSKKTGLRERKQLFWEIILHAEAIGVGVADSVLIDRVNILGATRIAMKQALEDLGRLPDAALIDAVALPSLHMPQFPIIKGDQKSACIAAASIVAKVFRDTLMENYHAQYPQYNFIRHKGYGTQEHLEMLRLHGPCPIHRKSFRPIMPELPL